MPLWALRSLPRILAGRWVKLTVAVNGKCMGRCKMCDRWIHPNDRAPTVEEYREGIDTKVLWVGLTGGEPLLRDDLPELVRFFVRERGAKIVNVNTLGTHAQTVERLTEAIKAAYPAKIVVSFSIHGNNLYKEITGVDTLEVALENLKHLRREVEGMNHASVVVECILWSRYPSGPIETANLLKKERVEARLVLCPYHEGSIYLHSSGVGMVEQPPQGVAAYVQKFNREIGSEERLIWRAIDRLFFNGLERIAKEGRSPIHCSAGHKSFYIDEFLLVRPCIFRREVLGNLREKKLSEIIRESGAWKRENRECRACWNPCETYPSFLLIENWPKLIKLISRA